MAGASSEVSGFSHLRKAVAHEERNSVRVAGDPGYCWIHFCANWCPLINSTLGGGEMRRVLSIAALVSLDLLVLWFGLVTRLAFHINVLMIWQQGGMMLTILLFAALVGMFMLLYKLIEMIINNFR
jgi:hypothetical protein